MYYNNEGLQKVFEEAKKWDPYSTNGKLGFTVRAAREFFYHFVSLEILSLQVKQIEECFVASMMTVYNEVQAVKKYDYLVFIEFQEMLCRIALNGMDPEYTIASRVQQLMSSIYDELVARGLWVANANKLVKVVPEGA